MIYDDWTLNLYNHLTIRIKMDLYAYAQIPIYEEIALFFLKLMYSSPFVYIPVGMTLWLFYPPKKG